MSMIMSDPHEFSSSFIPLIAAALALISAILILGTHVRKSSQKTKKYHPFGSTHLNKILHYNTLLDFITELCRKYKTYRLRSFSSSEIFTVDPAVVEHILKTNFPNYGKVINSLLYLYFE